MQSHQAAFLRLARDAFDTRDELGVSPCAPIARCATRPPGRTICTDFDHQLFIPTTTCRRGAKPDARVSLGVDRGAVDNLRMSNEWIKTHRIPIDVHKNPYYPINARSLSAQGCGRGARLVRAWPGDRRTPLRADTVRVGRSGFELVRKDRSSKRRLKMLVGAGSHCERQASRDVQRW